MENKNITKKRDCHNRHYNRIRIDFMSVIIVQFMNVEHFYELLRNEIVMYSQCGVSIQMLCFTFNYILTFKSKK